MYLRVSIADIFQTKKRKKRETEENEYQNLEIEVYVKSIVE